MALKDTIHVMKRELSELNRNLEKATSGNKAAAQRVRTGTIKLAKLAKIYRKESVAAEKKEAKSNKKNSARLKKK